MGKQSEEEEAKRVAINFFLLRNNFVFPFRPVLSSFNLTGNVCARVRWEFLSFYDATTFAPFTVDQFSSL